MTDILKSNDNLSHYNILLPLPPEAQDSDADMEIYVRFMRHLRMVPNNKPEIKVLAAIQFTADMLDVSDALIAKTLVDFGLRAPRQALPSDFLEFMDRVILRRGYDVGAPSASCASLKAFWDEIGEDKFAAYRGERIIAEPPMFVEV